ncbi:fusaric acid resistance family protein [Hasllibacter halocynthiae]|uniref:Fusaric acid resistance family protein n=1 Tax=Hasllibacter halocynthiae TaxID=595589 RepID=A0A2T0X9W6_9RHOB|nr:FUSC family protein [Hasllibacter halocynthiae]PRY95741.1 fusaric acid resistance family protein [Hasllibacter halocynthiae]
MYVTPRPDASEDPFYAVRLGLIGALAYSAIPLIDPALPPIICALPVGLIASQRKSFNVGKAIAGPVVMIVLVYVMTWAVEQMRPMPVLYVAVMWLTYFAGYLMILRTGAQAGMLIVIVSVLMSVMGMHGSATVETMRDGFVQAALVGLLIAPVVYWLVPPRTREAHVDTPVPGGGNVAIGAAIRATVLLGLSFWLYSVMQPSDMMMAVIAAMVLVFPTRRAVLWEALQRVRATFYGSMAAALALAVVVWSPHLPIVLGLVFLTGLYFGDRMIHGPHPSMVYQYAFSVMLALVAGALSTQDASYAVLTRIVLTLVGAGAAVAAVALLDGLTDWRGERRPIRGAGAA